MTSVDRPSSISAKALPMFARIGQERSCVVAFDVAISSADADVTVDWSRAALLVNNTARPAVPGFARTITNNLQQRPSTAPKGTLLREQVFALRDQPATDDDPERACIGPRTATIGLDLPIKLGDVAERVRFMETPSTIAVTELDALRELPQPEIRQVQRISCASIFGTVDSADDVAALESWRKMRKRIGAPAP